MRLQRIEGLAAGIGRGSSTVDRAGILWQPLVRDGGAKPGKRYTLYSLTKDRDGDDFNDNLQKITE